MARRCFAAVAMALILPAGTAHTEEIVLQQGVSPAGYAGCTDTTLIPDDTRPHGRDGALHLRGVANRLLIRFELPERLKGKPIDSAELWLFVPRLTKNEYYAEFICSRVLASWDASATWTHAAGDRRWAAPGGDLDRSTDYDNGRPAGAVDSEAFFAPAKKFWMPPPHLSPDVSPGGRWVRFDVTRVVEDWLSGRADNHGLCVTGINMFRKDAPQYAAAEVPGAEHEKDERLRPKLVIRPADESPGYLVAMTHTLRRWCDRSPRFRYRGGDVAAHRMAAARNEHEGFQVLVKPLRRRLEKVRFEWTDLTDPKSGKKIPRHRLTCYRLDTVRLIENWYARDVLRKLYDVPDPMLPAEPTDLARGAARPFWLELHVPEDAAAGEYAGTVRVVPANAPPRELKLTVRVWDYAIPKAWNFHTMGQMIWSEVRGYHGKVTPELYRRYADFLMAHRYAPTEQYSTKLSPDPDYIAEYVRRGGNTIYLSGNYRGDLQRVRRDYAKVREILGEKLRQVVCIVYVGDEVTARSRLKGLCEKADGIHAELPGAMVMIGGSYPHPELIGYLDVYDPKTSADPDSPAATADRLPYKMGDRKTAAVREARGRGEEVYFYGDLPPLADGLHGGLECPVIGPRVMMWQCWKYGINGHELYCYNQWKRNARGRDGRKWPAVPWHAESFRGRNAGGMMFYPGPCPSVRLKNARDGIEDWESFQVLADCADAIKARYPGPRAALPKKALKLLDDAERMLAVPETVTSGFTEWTRDGRVLLAERAKLSALIEQCIAIVGPDGCERAAAARRRMEADRRAVTLRERTRHAKARLGAAKKQPGADAR